MKNSLYVFLIVSVFACQSPDPGPVEGAAAPAVSTDGYELEPVAGTDLVSATKYEADGKLLEKGFFLNDQLEGTWSYYEHPTKEYPKRMANYHQGILQGPYLEFTEQGNIILKAYYQNNQLHGPWGAYKFGRPLKTANYVHGILDGVYREYTNNTGKLQKEIQYKNGKEHGTYRFFNDDGEVTLEYVYENGEKISGGIIETGSANAPK